MAYQILLDFSPQGSSSTTTLTLSDTGGGGDGGRSSRGGGGAGPDEAAPLGRTQTGGVRRRRWTPRARTGCLTCRTRRVKCDEERPVCRRCILGRLTCRGYQMPPSEKASPRKSSSDNGRRASLQTPPDTPPPPPQQQQQQQHGQTTALQAFGSAQRHHLHIEAEPPDWDMQEGIRYYFEVVVPGRTAEVRRGGHPDFHSKTFHFSRFISQVIGDQISRASKARGALIPPGRYPAFAGVWASYYRYLGSSIAVVNRHLQDPGAGHAWRVFYGIDQLLVLDLYVERSQWQAHIRGFFNYVRHRGGIAAVLRQPEPPFYCLNHVLSVAINVNTTSPARNQIHGFDDYTDQQLASVLNAAYSTSMQCPTELYLAMVHISRLRATLAAAAAGPGGPKHGDRGGKGEAAAATVVIERRVRRIFDSIARFSAQDWADKPEFGDTMDAVAAVGRIFAVAVRLYGIMTLPPSAVVASMRAGGGSSASDLERHDALRISQGRALLALVRRFWGRLSHTTSLCWPLIVAGVALAGGSPEDQNFVERSLLSIWRLPNTSACFILAIQKLRPFWNSGKTGWEDCFDTPIACIA
ncbi:hypothetical protein V2A60_000679 [Cordyceps javanica]